MPDANETLYGLQFANTVDLLPQSKGRLADCYVTGGPHKGEGASPVDYHGEVDGVDDLPKGADTPWLDGPVDRRWVFPRSWTWNRPILNEDVQKVLTNLQSPYVMQCAAAKGRAIDRRLITALLGVAKTGKQGGTDTPFDVNMSVASNVGAGGATGMNLQKVLKAKEAIGLKEIDLDQEEVKLLVTEKQHTDLLNDTKVISRDFAKEYVLENGRVTRVAGATVKVINQLNLVAAERACALYIKRALYLGPWSDMPAPRITERADKNYVPQVWMQNFWGATRLLEAGVCRILCAEA